MIDRSGFTVTPDPAIRPEDMIPRFGGAHPRGGPEGAEQRRGGLAREPPVDRGSCGHSPSSRRSGSGTVTCTVKCIDGQRDRQASALRHVALDGAAR
jgi:hypothetical protein